MAAVLAVVNFVLRPKFGRPEGIRVFALNLGLPFSSSCVLSLHFKPCAVRLVPQGVASCRIFWGAGQDSSILHWFRLSNRHLALENLL